MQGIIWSKTDIQKLLDDGQRFGIDLTDRNARCEVILEASVDFWLKKASVYLKIHRLNVVGMKGLKHQEREATIQQLTDEQLLTRNASRPWPTPVTFPPKARPLAKKRDCAADPPRECRPNET